MSDMLQPFSAVVFDMDGLLVDTESLAMRSLMQVAAEMNIDAPEAFCHTMIGVPADHCRMLVQERFGSGFPADHYLGAAGRHMEALIEAGALALKPGVLELLADLEALGTRKAVATSSSRAKAGRHLRRTGILGRFDAVITRDDVERGKPHPDLFLKAAQALGVPAGSCLAFEDSYNGVRAACAAGMTVVMVPDLLPPTDEMRARCAAILTNLHAARPMVSARLTAA
ncbi:HAD family hydrolase [Teichococcus aestuarii]|uniref:HAD family hydrolase n=1 Tax=Teichococcus aestuarii TaxID=568898 RepID=UPI00361E10B2